VIQVAEKVSNGKAECRSECARNPLIHNYFLTKNETSQVSSFSANMRFAWVIARLKRTRRNTANTGEYVATQCCH
jgi:hypothetical protein